MELYEKGSSMAAPNLTPSKTLPKGAKKIDKRRLRPSDYLYVYRTGPFLLPGDTHSLDWAVLNNDDGPQTVRVTVFKCNLGSAKTSEPPGPLALTIAPGETTHNANNASGGFYYEIQVECNSRLIFPYAASWPGNIGDPLPGSVVKSAEFIRQLSGFRNHAPKKD